MQYFLGLEEFDPNPVFDLSLFVEIRKRTGDEQFDQLNTALIKSSSMSGDQKYNGNPKKKKNDGSPENNGRFANGCDSCRPIHCLSDRSRDIE